MKKFILDIWRESFILFRARFLIFLTIAYFSTALTELSHQISFEENLALRYSSSFFSPLHPYLLIPALLGTFFTLAGFAALYFSFGGAGIADAVMRGLKNLHRYAGLFILGGAAVYVLFIGVPFLFSLALRLIDYVPPTLFADRYGMVITLPLIVVSLLPALYVLISFAIAPFILLYEECGIIRSFLLSYTRQHKNNFFRSALLLVSSFLVLAALYLILRRLLFDIKLAFIPDLSFRGESMLRVFAYSVPWVLVAVFFDLIVYELYLRLKPQEHGTKESDEKNDGVRDHTLATGSVGSQSELPGA